jgi:hypothetical protein
MTSAATAPLWKSQKLRATIKLEAVEGQKSNFKGFCCLNVLKSDIFDHLGKQFYVRFFCIKPR